MTSPKQNNQKVWCQFCYEDIETINESWDVWFCNTKCHDSYMELMNLLSQITLRREGSG